MISEPPCSPLDLRRFCCIIRIANPLCTWYVVSVGSCKSGGTSYAKEGWNDRRERTLATLHKQETDRLCFAPLIDDYFVSSLPAQNLNLDIQGALRYIGCDIMQRHVARAGTRIKNATVERKVSADGRTVRTSYITPVGTIYQEVKTAGASYLQTKHFVETLEDMKVLQYVWENTEYTENAKLFKEIDDQIGDDGIATMTTPKSPIQDLLQRLAGVENTVYLMADYPDEMDELLSVMHEANMREFRELVKYPGLVGIAYEDTSSTVMSRTMYQQYSAPYIDEYTKIMQDHGKIFITHMCGKLSAFAEDIGKGIQHGVDSVCPPTTGDLCAWDARRIWDPDKVIIGGIDPTVLVRLSVDETIAYVKAITDRMKGERGFILCTGDATVHGTPIENLVAIADFVKHNT